MISMREGLKEKAQDKKLVRVFFYIFLFLIFSSYIFFSSCSKKLNINELKVALSGDYFPFVYTENDTLKGLEIELLNLIEKNLKVPISISEYSFNQKLETFMESDNNIAIGGVTITDSRKGIFNFSLPYYDATTTVISKENSSIVVDSLKSLANHRLGVLNNSASLLLLENTLLRERILPANNLRRYNSLQSLLTGLNNNEIALILLDNTVAELVCEENDFKIIYKHISPIQYAIVFHKESNLVNYINKVLETILISTEWKEIKKNYLLN